jgi:FkbM family methyltransferase
MKKSAIENIKRTLLFNIGLFEPEFKIFIKKTKDRNIDTFIDIGANTGVLISYAAKFFKQSIAFEPDPEALIFLKARSEKYNFTVIDKAICAKKEIRTMYSTNGTGRSSFYKNKNYIAEKGIQINVECEDINFINKYISNNNKWAVKIDVEGSEAEIMHELLELNNELKPDMIYIEITPENIEDIKCLKIKENYHLFTFKHKNIVSEEKFQYISKDRKNYLLLKI